MVTWGFITNHGRVLEAIAKHRRNTVREISLTVGITERSTHKIIKDLEEAGYVSKTKVGRQNRYRIHPEKPLTLDERDDAVGDLLEALGWKKPNS